HTAMGVVLSSRASLASHRSTSLHQKTATPDSSRNEGRNLRMHPPDKTTQHNIERMARNLEQTMARRRRLLKELRDLDQHIRSRRKLLRDVIADATAPVADIMPGRQPDDRASEFASHGPKTRPKPRRARKISRPQK